MILGALEGLAGRDGCGDDTDIGFAGTGGGSSSSPPLSTLGSPSPIMDDFLLIVLRDREELRDSDADPVSVVRFRPRVSSKCVEGRREGAFCNLRGEDGVMMMSDGGGINALLGLETGPGSGGRAGRGRSIGRGGVDFSSDARGVARAAEREVVRGVRAGRKASSAISGDRGPRRRIVCSGDDCNEHLPPRQHHSARTHLCTNGIARRPPILARPLPLYRSAPFRQCL